MPPRYRELLDSLRREFPQPVSDPVHDAYVVFSILRALDQVDALKGKAPDPGLARRARLRRGAGRPRRRHAASRLERVIPELVKHLEGMFIWGHPQSQVNVVAHPVDRQHHRRAACRRRTTPTCAATKAAAAFRTPKSAPRRWPPTWSATTPTQAGGVFTFGGTGGMLYGVKIGLEKAVPGCLRTGLTQDAVVLACEQSHSCCLNVAGWLGIGQDHVVLVPTHLDNSIDVPRLVDAARAGAVRRQTHRRDRGHDGLDRRLRHRRPARHRRRCATAWSANSRSTTGRTSTPTP